jgi:hypothetical protein
MADVSVRRTGHDMSCPYEETATASKTPPFAEGAKDGAPVGFVATAFQASVVSHLYAAKGAHLKGGRYKGQRLIAGGDG